MLKIALFAVAAVLAALMLKSVKSELALFVTLAAGIVITVCCVTKLDVLVQFMEKMQKLVNIKAEYISILLKMAGIAYVSEITSGICRDCGYNAIAGQVEMFGRLCVTVAGVPVVMALVETIEGLN